MLLFILRCGVVVITTAQLHLTKCELNSVQFQIVLAACWRFAMVRISYNSPGWNYFLNTVGQPFCKNNSSPSSSSSSSSSSSLCSKRGKWFKCYMQSLFYEMNVP